MSFAFIRLSTRALSLSETVLEKVKSSPSQFGKDHCPTGCNDGKSKADKQKSEKKEEKIKKEVEHDKQKEQRDFKKDVEDTIDRTLTPQS